MKDRAIVRWSAALVLLLVGGASCELLQEEHARKVRGFADRATAGLEIGSEAKEKIDELDAMLGLAEHYAGDAGPVDLAAVLEDARHAARVYESRDEIQRQLGDVTVNTLANVLFGLQYYVVIEEHRTLVAIRGTNAADPRNWITDLVIDREPDEVLGIDVHEGFLTAARTVEAELLATGLTKGRPVHLTGHSLGGSLATLLGLRLEKQGFTVSVTTFGAPKITTFAAFRGADFLHDLDLRRFVNEGDMAQHFPPPMERTGEEVYAHFGREWILTAAGRSEPTKMPEGIFKSAIPFVDPNSDEWELKEHFIALYVERLTALASEEPTPETP